MSNDTTEDHWKRRYEKLEHQMEEEIAKKEEEIAKKDKKIDEL